MFGWRKRQIADQVDRDIDATAQPVAWVPNRDINATAQPDADQTEPAPVAANKDALYTVGVNPAGNTQLVLKIAYGSTTLTMEPGSVRRLIRLLEATLEEESK